MLLGSVSRWLVFHIFIAKLLNPLGLLSLVSTPLCEISLILQYITFMYNIHVVVQTFLVDQLLRTSVTSEVFLGNEKYLCDGECSLMVVEETLSKAHSSSALQDGFSSCSLYLLLKLVHGKTWPVRLVLIIL